MAKVNMHEAKSNLSKLVEAIERGEEVEIVLARNGTPVARIVPLEQMFAHEVTSRLGIAEGMFDQTFEGFGEADAEFADAMIEGPIFPDEVAGPAGRKKSA